jgi:hypothetical protein
VCAENAISVLGDVSDESGSVAVLLAALAEEHCTVNAQLQRAYSAAQSAQALAELQQQYRDFDESFSRGDLSVSGPTLRCMAHD